MGGKVTLRAHASFISVYNGSRDGSVTFEPLGDNRVALAYVTHTDPGSNQDPGYPQLDGVEMTILSEGTGGPETHMYYTLNPNLGSQSFESRLNNGQEFVAYIAQFDNVVQQVPPNQKETGGAPSDSIATDHESDMVFSHVARERNGPHNEPEYTPIADQTEVAEVISVGDIGGTWPEIRMAAGWKRGEPAPGGSTTVGWNESSTHIMNTTHLKAAPQRNNAILLLSMLPGLLVPAGMGKLLIPQMLGLWKEAF